MKKLSPTVRSFLTAIIVIFVLMCIAYVLTLVLPAGQYTYVADENGNMVIDTSVPFQYTEGGISFVKWLFSPILVLTSSTAGTLIAVIIFLLVIGGIFAALKDCGLMEYMLNVITIRYRDSRYKLLAMLVLFFMSMGSLIGSFEEVIPMVPIATALCISLGFDALTGISVSMLAVGCGFSCGITNPFSVGIAQTLAGLPMFSGVWLRIVTFAIIYALLMAFIIAHCHKIERPAQQAEQTFQANPDMGRAMKLFAIVMGISLVIILSSSFIPALQDYTMIIVALAFLVSGTVSSLMTKMEVRKFFCSFGAGAFEVLPAAVMILMAASIRYTLEEAKVIDTLLYYIISAIGDTPRAVVILVIYLIVLLIEIFVSSGSAKAIMLMPLILPIAQIFGISSQLCVLAYAFGDGFSNIIYPTNPGLLISLGLAEVSYGEWFRHSYKFIAAVLVITSCLLLFGLAIGY